MHFAATVLTNSEIEMVREKMGTDLFSFGSSYLKIGKSNLKNRFHFEELRYLLLIHY